MNPGVPTPDSFWAHFPHWIWPIIIAGIAAYFLYQSIKTFGVVAAAFGRFGKYIHGKANANERVLKHVKRIEDKLERASDRLECATSYLIDDQQWHDEVDLILPPSIARLLPHRVTYATYRQRWREGYRPSAYQEE